MCAWASASQFLSHNSATIQFQVVVIMQMDAKIEKEQIGTLSVWVGALEGGFGGGGGPSGVPTLRKSISAFQINKKQPPGRGHHFLENVFFQRGW